MGFLEILTNYILPIIYDSFVSLVLVLFFLFIFRIKDSNIRILFFFLPIIKPFIIISERIDINNLYFQARPFSGGFRFPDPANIINIFGNLESKPIIIISNPNYFILILTIIAIFIALLIRWTLIALFYKSLAYEEKVGEKDIPEIYNIINKYTERTKTKVPDVSLTYRNYFSPFIVGIKNFTLVLSPNLVEKLNISEKETLIQHELSHIKRNDNLIGWVALILRDLLFFNPFAYMAHSLIKSEQEKGSDKLVVKYSDKTAKEIAKNILNAILKISLTTTSKPISELTQSFAFSPFSLFSNIKLKNRINSIIKTNPDKIYSCIFPKILMYFLFLTLLLIQFVFVVKINNLIIFLR